MTHHPTSATRRALAAIALAAGVVGLAALCDVTLATDAARAPRPLVALGLFVTEFGTSGYMFAYSALVALGAILALGQGHVAWRGVALHAIAVRALYFFAAIAASGLLVQGIKHLVGRSRPKLMPSDGAFHFHFLSLPDAMASFPSGHTTSAFAAAVALGILQPRWRWWWLAAAVTIGASRVLVGAHYPSDVAAGAALGATVSVLLARALARRGFAVAAGRGGLAPPPPRPHPAGPEVQH